ncbi:hypothetical protein M422DRAFT_245281 [Sphaerobolus stellatus SS14]|nr:hypothetical protein M422DRAFT_245281 [Sphaerobolus stellatus SS14]
MEAFTEAFTEAWSREVVWWRLVRWVVCNNQPYLIVEDEDFVDLLHMLRLKVSIPCANTVSNDVKVHSMVKAVVVETLKGFQGTVHTALDGWTAKKASSFMGLTLQWCL